MLQDFHALRLSLDELRANPPATKIECEDASGSTLRQASGAFGQIEHIEVADRPEPPQIPFFAPANGAIRRRQRPLPRRGYSYCGVSVMFLG